MKQTGLQLASMDEENQLYQKHEEDINIPVASHANLPCLDLLTGDRENYIKIGLPLYKASVKGDWEAAKVILDQKPELVGYSITENGDTPLHVVAAARQTRRVKMFVENLLDLMNKDEVALENKKQDNALYLACVAGNIETVKVLVKKNSALLVNAGIQGKMMPLQAAALYGNHKVVKYLYEKSKDLADDGWTHENRSWLLLKCVETDMFDIAIRIVKKYPKLRSSGSVLGVLARKPEAFEQRNFIMDFGIFNIFTTLWGFKVNAKSTKDLKNGHSENDREALVLLRIIWEDISKKPKKVIDDILRGPPDLKQDNKLVSGNVDHALQLQKLISECIVNMHIEIQKIVRQPPDSVNQNINPTIRNDDQGMQPQQHFSKQIAKMQAATTLNDQSVPAFGNADETYSSRVLFVAAEMGNAIFIVELIRQYPDLIWQVNDNNQSIFHIAIQNRHENIYNLRNEIGGMMDLITHLRDEQDNNMLHIVAKSSVNQKRLKLVSAVFKMQRDLLWFLEIESMIPPSYREQKNKDGLTPHELFTKEHKSLHAQAEDWMKTTANQSMVIAVLVATIAFAAAFTIPGGYDQNNGIPMFHSNIAFLVFVISDAISLVSSSTSIILMFLTILKSPYAEMDFLQLTGIALLGFQALFLSLISMMIAFSASFYVLYDKQMSWIPILITSISMCPISLYYWLQYGLLFEVFQFHIGSRYLFNPIKRVLY